MICSLWFASRTTLCLLMEAKISLFLIFLFSRAYFLNIHFKIVENSLQGAVKAASLGAFSGSMTSSSNISSLLTSSWVVTSSMELPAVSTLLASSALTIDDLVWRGRQLRAVFKASTALVTAPGITRAREAYLWTLNLILHFSVSRMRRHRASCTSPRDVLMVTE